MNTLEAALLDVTGFLESERTPYMVIGGFANLYWGRPRLTQDLDIKVKLAEPSWAEFAEVLGRRYRLLAADPLAFARETHVIPLSTPSGVRTDLILASLPYEEEALRRAVTVEVGGRPVRLCTAEDLILHKVISDRGRDRDDVGGIAARQGASLDRRYLDPKVREMAAGLERPDILVFYRSCLEQAGLHAP